MPKPALEYPFNSTKEFVHAFPCAYRQWKADTWCNQLHGYDFSIRLFFGTDYLDARNWVADFGGLKELKEILSKQFDHKLLVAADDPDLDWFKEADRRGIAKITILDALGCERLSDMIYKFMNTVYIPDYWGKYEAERIWCYRVEVRETQANMGFRIGHREWGENLFENL